MGKPEKFDEMDAFHSRINFAHIELKDRVIRIHGTPEEAAELAEYYTEEVCDPSTPKVVLEEWKLMISRAARETLPRYLGMESKPRPALFGLPALKVWMEAKALEFAEQKIREDES